MEYDRGQYNNFFSLFFFLFMRHEKAQLHPCIYQAKNQINDQKIQNQIK